MNRWVFLLLCLGISISACGQESQGIDTTMPQPVIQAAASGEPDPPLTAEPPTPLPTSTSTAQPALTAHEWRPERVLIRADLTPGDGGDVFSAPSLPVFILYADGSLFIQTHLVQEEQERSVIWHQKLDRKGICAYLNTLDQAGFLDYDPAAYEFQGGKLMVMGAGGAAITVNAWRTFDGRFYELPIFMRDELTGELGQMLGEDFRTGRPVIHPALRSAYYLLFDHPVDDMEIYSPDRLAIWIDSNPGYEFDVSRAREWPFQDPSLKSLLSKSGNKPMEFPNFVVVEGQIARDIYDFMGNSYFVYDVYFNVRGDGVRDYYSVMARPILPYELPSGTLTRIPAPGSTRPDFSLSCDPGDGILPISVPVRP
jgi:hypothetical protein